MSLQKRLLLASTFLAVATLNAPAIAQSTEDRFKALEARIEAQDARIADLESQLAKADSGVDVASSDTYPEIAARSEKSGRSELVALALPGSVRQENSLDISGDFRLRQEFNWSDRDAQSRTRSVMRARLRASYAVNDKVTVGAQISTGDPDDPNTTDLTIGNFVDDLNASLDKAYVKAKFGDLTISGGKFANPFQRTDLVWDGDVNPQGLGATYTNPLGTGGAKLEVRGLYFLLNESVAGKGSDMLGAQLALSVPIGPDWHADISAAYYDYRIRSIAGADAGDFRSNLSRLDGSYLSDFNLGDVIANVTYRGLGEKWPVGVTADVVYNFGSATDEDTGYSVEVFAGQTMALGDLRFGYSYSVVDTDAVFAAFSNDNLGIATNYRLHALSVDYVPLKDTVLNLSYYMYRPKDTAFAGLDDPADWLNRLRVNMLFNF